MLKYSKEEKLRLLKAYELSGMKQSDFCRLHGLTSSSLCNWRASKSMKTEPKRGEFIELGKPREGYYELHRNGYVLKIPVSESLSRVAELLRSL